MIILETQRLLLRTWCDTDLEPMTTINQDPKVMHYFPAPGNQQQTQDHLERIDHHQNTYGYSLYAAELKSSVEMIGFVGFIHRTADDFDAPFIPATEIGWRLATTHWNQGYATEAAQALCHYGFNQLGLPEIVSFTTLHNLPSRRVMEKIGLHHFPQDDFDHPAMEKSHPLCRQVLYRLTRSEYIKKHSDQNTRLI